METDDMPPGPLKWQHKQQSAWLSERYYIGHERSPASDMSGDATFANLPEDILIGIADYLDPWDIVHLQRVSKTCHQAFSDFYLLRHMLNEHFQRTREVRELIRNDHFDRLMAQEDSEGSLRKLFNKLACRYYHLESGRPYSVLSVTPAVADHTSWTLYPVNSWEYHRSREPGYSSGMPRNTFKHSFWSYDDGLLVYPMEESEELVIMDLERETIVPVPFTVRGKVIRNFRLKDNILAVEWAESSSYHALNASDSVYRHFVSFYRVSRHTPSTFPDGTSPFQISFHAEVKLHFLGLPLTDSDRFFSTHTSQHYAVYFWQPNRSIYTGDEEAPLELLCIWDIATPSDYLPSTDPAGTHANPDNPIGPKRIAHLNFNDLDFYGVRQHGIPALMNLRLDSPSGVLLIHENQKHYTPGYFDPAERNLRASSTLIPFTSYGPHRCLEDDDVGNATGTVLPPYVGNCSLESDEDRWEDHMAETRRYENWINVVDREAGVLFSLARTTFNGADRDNTMNWTVLRIGVGFDTCHAGIPGFEGEPVIAGDGHNAHQRNIIPERGRMTGNPKEARSCEGLVQQQDRQQQQRREKALDSQYEKLVLKGGKLAGDERWLVGQGEDGLINILKFDS